LQYSKLYSGTDLNGGYAGTAGEKRGTTARSMIFRLFIVVAGGSLFIAIVFHTAGEKISCHG